MAHRFILDRKARPSRALALGLAFGICGLWPTLLWPQQAQADEAYMTGPGGEHMTPEMFNEIREKIAVYRDYSDEQIMQKMSLMPNFDVYVSAESVSGEIGILALTHGFRDPLNAEFEKAMKPPAEDYPTAIGYGMAIMTSAHIQAAVDKLEAAGAKTIVILPVTTLMHSRMLRQWDYIFSRRDEAEYMSVPHIKTEARLVLAETPTQDPVLARIMLDHASELSTDPADEVVIVVSHGPTFVEDNVVELAILEKHADWIAENSDFSEVKAITIQDDALAEIRSANVATLRSWVEAATAEGKRAILVTNLILLPSFHKRLEADLAGLEYQLNTKGVMLHPAMANWIEEVVNREASNM